MKQTRGICSKCVFRKEALITDETTPDILSNQLTAANKRLGFFKFNKRKENKQIIHELNSIPN